MFSKLQMHRMPGSPRIVLWLALALAVLFPACAQAQVSITTTALPAASLVTSVNSGATYSGNAYSVTLAATGGAAPYTWSLLNGTLPAGLSLSSGGVISGKATALTSGTPPAPTSFTVQVTDSQGSGATQTYSIPVTGAGSHSLVINQFFHGGNDAGGTGSPYFNDYVEIFNAAPAPVDLQNWTLQSASVSSSSLTFAQTAAFPLGSLDAYTAGTTGGPNGNGTYPAFHIAYSTAFTASNCNPALPATPLNPAFPPSHCWLNPGQFLLVLLRGNTSGSETAATYPIQVSADLDLSGALLSNAGAISATSNWLGSSTVTASNAYLPGASDGAIAIVNGVGIGVVCPSGTGTNPKPYAAFSPQATDLLPYFAQNSGGTIVAPVCWEGATAQYGFALDASSSLKNTDALIRSAGNGKKGSVSGTGPLGVALSTGTEVLTPCGDSDDNQSDFASILIGKSGLANWVLHNSQQFITPATATSGTPASYTPTPCQGLNAVGPLVTASLSQSTVIAGSGNGVTTDTLTVTVTPASNPTSTLFNVHVDLSGAPALTSPTPLTASSVGVPDGNGNYVFTEPIAVPTTNTGTYAIPVTVVDDAYRGGVNANYQTPLVVTLTVGNGCAAPSGTAQTLTMNWNAPNAVTLNGQVGQNCQSGDTLTYAIASQPKNGIVSAVSGNQVTYTPNNGFAGPDSFTYTVTDSTASLTSAPIAVNLLVSETGVVPTIAINCPTVTYDGNSHGCTYTVTPYVAGSSTLTYAGSPAAPTTAGSYPVQVNFVANSGASQNASATSSLVINPYTTKMTMSCPMIAYDGSVHSCTTGVTGIGSAPVSGTTVVTYNGSSTAPSAGGTYAVVATFTSSDPNFSNASATGTMLIDGSAATIAANNATMTYGDAVPTLTYTISPSLYLQVAPVCTTSTTAASAVGTYTGAITCSGASKTGVTFTYVPGNMTIAPAAATVTANNQTIAAGSAIPTLTYTTTPAGVTFTTAPQCTTTATAASPVGSYPITCSGGVSANYTLSYAAGALTVNPAPAVPNAMPTISSVSPMTVAAGSSDTTVTIGGTGFMASATARWNGIAMHTQYVSPTQLTAVIPAASLSATGTGDLTVFTPAPGGGLSPSLTLAIDTPQTAGGFTASGSPSPLQLTRGQTLADPLEFSNLLRGASVTVTCFNLPAQGYCSYTSGVLTIGAGPASPAGTYPVLVVANTNSPLIASNSSPSSAMWCGLFGFPIALLVFYRGRKSRICSVILLALAFSLYGTGCGGNATNNGSSTSLKQSSFSVSLIVK